MAKTNSKKVILADNLGRIVAEIVSSKTKEYLNKGYILLGFSSIVSGGLFKVSLFEDSSLENEFRVIIVETNHVKALEDEIFKKGFINWSKFTKVYTGTVSKEIAEETLYIGKIFETNNKTEIYSILSLDNKVLISFDEAREVAKKRADRYERTTKWICDYHYDIPESKRGSIFGENDVVAVRYKRMSFPDMKIEYLPFYDVIDEESNRRKVDLSVFYKKKSNV